MTKLKGKKEIRNGKTQSKHELLLRKFCLIMTDGYKDRVLDMV